MPDASIHVSRATHWLTGLVVKHPKTWIKIGSMESRLLAPELSNMGIHAPLYVSGLARSGSTMLLEMLASHPDTASHHYGDFPFLFTPCWWNSVLSLMGKKKSPLKERAQGDGIYINASSPEAMEEMLWMAFFDLLHQPESSHILDGSVYNPEFERFYRDHIKKILLLRKAPRYLAKANYNATRLAYLHKLFPDARFVVPIRNPVAHVESLIRQHRRFTQAAHNNPRVTLQMQAGGHFEFGPHRQPIHTGDNKKMQQVIEADIENDHTLYYALQWDMLYRFLYRQFHDLPSLAKAVLVVPFEEFCAKPYETLKDVYSHCQLTIDKETLKNRSEKIHAPSYTSELTEKECMRINDICHETAQCYGY